MWHKRVHIVKFCLSSIQEEAKLYTVLEFRATVIVCLVISNKRKEGFQDVGIILCLDSGDDYSGVLNWRATLLLYVQFSVCSLISAKI